MRLMRKVEREKLERKVASIPHKTKERKDYYSHGGAQFTQKRKNLVTF